MRFTDQYVWNFLFTLFFLTLVIFGGILLQTYAPVSIRNVTFLELLILVLATLRLTRLFISDRITAFFREQFYNVRVADGKDILEKPSRGPRRTLAGLLSCPWCFGVWAGATVVFFYYLTPLSHYPILFLAVAGAGTMLQLLASMIVGKTEPLRDRLER